MISHCTKCARREKCRIWRLHGKPEKILNCSWFATLSAEAPR